MPLSKAHLAAYRQRCISSNEPLPTDLIPGPNINHQSVAKSIFECVDNAFSLKNMMDQYSQLIVTNPGTKYFGPDNGRMISVERDGNSSASSLVFGVLIAASIALLHHTNSEVSMRKTLLIMLNEAIELRTLYQQGWAELTVQSNHFPKACNTVIELINSILFNKIFTSEIIHQANKDLSRQPGSLNPALADLANFMLYKERLTTVTTQSPEFIKQMERLNFHQHPDQKQWGSMSFLMNAYTPYNTLDQHLLCSHLNVNVQTLYVQPDGDIRLDQDGILEQPISCTLVNSMNHTNIFFDLRMQTQIEYEKLFSSVLTDLEHHCTKPGIGYTPISLTPGKIPTHKQVQCNLQPSTRALSLFNARRAVHPLDRVVENRTQPVGQSVRRRVPINQHKPVITPDAPSAGADNPPRYFSKGFFSGLFCWRSERKNPAPQNRPASNRM